MKKIIILIVIQISFISFSQDNSNASHKLELKIRENNQRALSKVNNDLVVERKHVNEDKHEYKLDKSNREKHLRPHFDKTNNRENQNREHRNHELKQGNKEERHHRNDRHNR